MNTRPSAPSWIGFWSGPLLWFAQQQALFWSLPASCHRPWIAPSLASVFVLALAVAGLYAWRGAAAAADQPGSPASALMRFVYGLGVLSPAVFAVVMIWQSLATFGYDACLR